MVGSQIRLIDDKILTYDSYDSILANEVLLFYGDITEINRKCYFGLDKKQRFYTEFYRMQLMKYKLYLAILS